MIGFPPKLGSKKEELKLRSVNNIVIDPAKTGRERINKKTVTKTDHTKRLIWPKLIAVLRKFFVVHIKLIPPKIELRPAQWRLKIAKSTLYPGWPLVLNGG